MITLSENLTMSCMLLLFVCFSVPYLHYFGSKKTCHWLISLGAHKLVWVSRPLCSCSLWLLLHVNPDTLHVMMRLLSRVTLLKLVLLVQYVWFLLWVVYMIWTGCNKVFFNLNLNLNILLALCAENSPVNGEFPSQRPVTRSFDVSFDLRMHKQLSKQSWGWWFETPSLSL